MALRSDRHRPCSRVSGVAMPHHTRRRRPVRCAGAGNEVSWRPTSGAEQNQSSTEATSIMYAEARWSVHQPLWQTASVQPRGRLCRLALTSSRPSVRLSASPDARIIDVSSSRTSTVPDVLLNARAAGRRRHWTTRQPRGRRPHGLRRRAVRRRRKREGKQVSDDVRQRALISASRRRLP